MELLSSSLSFARAAGSGRDTLESKPMRRQMVKLGVVGVLALVWLPACGGSRGPQPGDTITPQMDPVVQWPAGKPVSIPVRLLAQAAGEAKPRTLSFNGIPSEINPKAAVTFYDGDQVLSTVEVALSHRC